MLKCGPKFCSNSEIKLNFDVRQCINGKIENFPNWKGNCFFQRQGAGCQECGGRIVRGNGCSYCIVCGWSKCG